jgi:hypothetical protein
VTISAMTAPIQWEMSGADTPWTWSSPDTSTKQASRMPIRKRSSLGNSSTTLETTSRGPVSIATSSTTHIAIVTDMAMVEVGALLDSGRGIYFEDGSDYPFYDHLYDTVQKFGNVAIQEIERQILGELISPEIGAIVLRRLGEIEDNSTSWKRLNLLSKAVLQHPSPHVRDGAALGLASLKQHDAIPYLEQAVKQEKLEYLRRNMQQVLTYLQETE